MSTAVEEEGVRDCYVTPVLCQPRPRSMCLGVLISVEVVMVRTQREMKRTTLDVDMRCSGAVGEVCR